MSIVTLLWPAFVLAILLVFIHAIFGLEIIKRGVIFTDLPTGYSIVFVSSLTGVVAALVFGNANSKI